MSDVVILKKDILFAKEETCPNCMSEVEHLISDTNSEYYYCKNCDYNKELVQKHRTFDSILKSIQENFLQIIKRNDNKLKICLYKQDNKILLSINDYEINSIEFLGYISDKDKSNLKDIIENIVYDLGQDDYLETIVNILI